jgi:hypothetical protein
MKHGRGTEGERGSRFVGEVSQRRGEVRSFYGGAEVTNVVLLVVYPLMGACLLAGLACSVGFEKAGPLRRDCVMQPWITRLSLGF